MKIKLGTLTLLLVLLVCSAAMASETFLVSSADYKNIILQKYKLDHGQITLVGSKVIPTDAAWGIFNTAIVHRKINNSPVFDVYFGECQDMECVDVILSMKRLDSSFNIQFEKNDILPRQYWYDISGLSTISLKQGSATSFRILTGTGDVVSERLLDLDGNLGAPANVAFQGKYLNATSAKDGRMVVAARSDNVLQIRTFHPAGNVTKVRISDSLFSLSLSDAITSSKIAKPYRLLLYRVNRGSLEAPTRAIVMQRLDNASGKFIGDPKTLDGFRKIEYFLSGQNYKSVAITPAGNVIFFTKYEPSCNRELVWGQVFDPQNFKKIGSPQLLIGCDTFSLEGRYLQGLDVVKLEF